MISFRNVKEIPDKLKYFATLQLKNNILLVGGMNTYFENLEDPFSDQFERAYGDSFLFDVKQKKLLAHIPMKVARAKHCLALCPDPKDKYNKLILAIGGVYFTNKRDLFIKKTFQKVHDTNSVEFYSVKDKTWERFNARLSIARHSASACYHNDYIYVIGGHTVDQPQKFINTLERCHKDVNQSFFHVINIRQHMVNLSIQNQLAIPLREDKGILILSCSQEDASKNHGFFIDLKDKEMKESKFDYSVGPINHWHNSYETYEQKINFLTEQLQILRFESQKCSWTLFDIEIEKDESLTDQTKIDDSNDGYQYVEQDDGSHHYYRDNFYAY